MESKAERSQHVPNGTGAASGKFMLSLGGGRKHVLSRQQHSAVKRNRTSLLGDLVEEEENEHHERIYSFGSSLADTELKNSERGNRERVIEAIPDKDWRAESRRLKRENKNVAQGGDIRLKSEVVSKGQTKLDAEADVASGSLPKFGLNVVAQGSAEDFSQVTEEVANLQHTIDQDNPRDPLSYPESRAQTADEEALAALLGNRPDRNTSVIEPAPPTEEEAFRDSYRTAPRDCTLEEYEATPVEGYGAAILRGYLKKGQTLDDHPRNGGVKDLEKLGGDLQRRPGLLGLGAKESGLGVELGAWGKGSGRPRAKNSWSADAIYNPLARRNKETGDIIPEDELKAKLESQKMQREDNHSPDKTFPNGHANAPRSEKGFRSRTTPDRDRESRRRRSRERTGEFYDGRDRQRFRRKHNDSEEESNLSERRKEEEGYDIAKQERRRRGSTDQRYGSGRRRQGDDDDRYRARNDERNRHRRRKS